MAQTSSVHVHDAAIRDYRQRQQVLHNFITNQYEQHEAWLTNPPALPPTVEPEPGQPQRETLDHLTFVSGTFLGVLLLSLYVTTNTITILRYRSLGYSTFQQSAVLWRQSTYQW